MKKQALILSAFILTGLFVQGCGGSDKTPEKKQTEEVKVEYQCPMKCTEQKFDKPGKCPVCGMELEKITKS